MFARNESNICIDCGRENLEDEPRESRPMSATTDDIVQKVKEFYVIPHY